MGLLNSLKNNSNEENLNAELHQALSLSREGKHIEAYPIFERLYYNQRNATNRFNLFQCAVYCGKTEIENKLYEIGIGSIASISGRYYAMDRDNNYNIISFF